MTIRRSIATTAVVLSLLAGGGAVAYAAADPAPTPDPPETGWATGDCPMGLDADDRAAFRAERRGVTDTWTEEMRAEMDRWRAEARALADALADAGTAEERDEVIGQLEAARQEHRETMQELGDTRVGDMAELREQRRAERDGRPGGPGAGTGHGMGAGMGMGSGMGWGMGQTDA